MTLYIRSGLLLFILTCFSCEGVNRGVLPSSTGKPGEIIVVIAQNHWESKLGETIRKVLAAPHAALPQEEPLFDLVNVKKGGLKGILKYHRNILYLDIGSSSQKAMIMKRDVWAKGQTTVTVFAKNSSEAVELILSKSLKLTSHFIDAERYRLMKNISKIKNKKLSDDLEKMLQIKLSVPKDYKITTKAKRFVWISKETREISQGIFIYDYPYIDKKSFSADNIIYMRNSVTRAHVPGPRDGSYMAVAKEFPPVVKEVNFNDNYALEVRGLWNVAGDFMGGPYISYTILDVERQRVVCAEAYVYAPKYNKRNYLRQLEAILLTLKFTEN